MFYVLGQSTLYNYADDNIVSHMSDEAKDRIACLESHCSKLTV